MYRCGSLFDLQIHTAILFITNLNVYEDGNRNQKESIFHICNKEQVIFRMWICDSFSINLSDDSLISDAGNCATLVDLSDMARNYSGGLFICPPALRLKILP